VVTEEIELTEADVEYVDGYDDGEITSLLVTPDMTPIDCRQCTKYQADCVCPMPKKEER
jgi:hypothetical protein